MIIKLAATKLAAATIVSGVLAAPFVASGAQTVTAQVPNLTKVAGGSVSGTVTPATVNNATITPFTVKNVGGGTWDYTVSRGFNGTTVTSDYINNKLFHSATSICGPTTNTVYAAAKRWARSSANAGLFADYAMYWDTYN